LRHEAGDGGGVAGVLLMAKRNHAHACGLCHAGEVRDRDTGQTEDRVDAVELQGIDHQIESRQSLPVRHPMCDLRFNGSIPPPTL